MVCTELSLAALPAVEGRRSLSSLCLGLDRDGVHATAITIWRNPRVPRLWFGLEGFGLSNVPLCIGSTRRDSSVPCPSSPLADWSSAARMPPPGFLIPAPAWAGIIFSWCLPYAPAITYSDSDTHLNSISADDILVNGIAFFASLLTSSIVFPSALQKLFASMIISAFTTLPATNMPPALCFIIK